MMGQYEKKQNVIFYSYCSGIIDNIFLFFLDNICELFCRIKRIWEVFQKFCIVQQFFTRGNMVASKLYACVKLAIHLVYFTYDATFAGCLLKRRQSVNQCELMYIHLAYIMLFSYFCVTCENSEFCAIMFFYIIPLNFCMRTAPYANLTRYMNYKMRYTKNLGKQGYTFLLFRIIMLCNTR